MRRVTVKNLGQDVLEQHPDRRAGPRQRNQRDPVRSSRRDDGGEIENALRHATASHRKCLLKDGQIAWRGERLRTQHFAVMALTALDQALFLGHFDRSEVDGFEQKADILRAVAAGEGFDA